MLIIFFIIGLAIGSFLNVVVYRLRVAETLFFDRSHCPYCKKIIHWYDNIPVISFVLLNFRCRYCKEKISWQYPLVEISTGLLFALTAFYFFDAGSSASWYYVIYLLVALSALLVIFVYDFLYLEIPDAVIWPAVVWAMAFGLLFDWNISGSQEDMPSVSMVSRLLAAFLAFSFFFSLSKFSKEKWMGMGDAYLAILLGLILGWPKILLALFLAFGAGAFYGIILIVIRKKEMKSQIPFAPFLVLGTMAAVFFYQPIVNWYWGLFF